MISEARLPMFKPQFFHKLAVTLSKFHNLLVPRFPHLYNKVVSYGYLRIRWANICMKPLGQGLAHSEPPICDMWCCHHKEVWYQKSKCVSSGVRLPKIKSYFLTCEMQKIIVLTLTGSLWDWNGQCLILGKDGCISSGPKCHVCKTHHYFMD